MTGTCEWTLTRTVIINTRNGEGSEKLTSKQIFSDKKLADATRAQEKTFIHRAMKSCYGRPATVEDIITIGDIIVNAYDIIAVGLRITPVQITVGNLEPTSDNEDPETK